MSWYKHLTVKSVRDFGQLRLFSMPLYNHTCYWSSTTSDSSFSLALQAHPAVSFTIINTSKQYHMTRGPTWSLTCELLDITTCRLKCCFLQTNPITWIKGGGGHYWWIMYIKNMGEEGTYTLVCHYTDRLLDNMSRPPISFCTHGIKKKGFNVPSHHIMSLQSESVNLYW